MNLSIDVITHIFSFGDRLPRYKGVSRTWMQATELMYPRWKKHLDVEYPFWDKITSALLLQYYLLKSIFHSDWDSFQVMIDLGWPIHLPDHSFMAAILIELNNWRLSKWLFLRFPHFKMMIHLNIYFSCMELPELMSEIIKAKYPLLKGRVCSPYLTSEMAQEIRKYLPSFRETGEYIIKIQMRENKHRPIISTGPVTPEIAEYMKKYNLRSDGLLMNTYIFPDDCVDPEGKPSTFIAWCQGMHIPIPENALTMKLHERILFINKHR